MELRIDSQNHVVLLVEIDEKFAKFISPAKSRVDVRKLPASEFRREYPLRYDGYPLEDYASKMLNKTSLGAVVTSHAKAILLGIINKEPTMGKLANAAPTKTAPVEEPKAKGKVTKVENKTEAAETTEDGSARNRREKIDGGKKIKVLKENPARSGTVRHAIVDTIFAAKTVQEAISSTVTRKDGEGEYKIGMPDIYFALENGLIEVY